MVEKFYSSFVTRSEKDGPISFPGQLSGKQKTEKNVKELAVEWIDVDNGASYAEVTRAALATGLFFIQHPTHNYITNRVEIALNKYVDWCVKEKGGKEAGYDPNAPTIPTVKEYMRERMHHTDRIIESVSRVWTDQIEGGWHVLADTDTIEKQRIGFVLDEPVKSHPDTQRQREMKTAWGEKMRGLAAMIGVKVDEATLDLSRGYYFPSRRASSDNPKIVINRAGRALDWSTVERVAKAGAVASDPFAATGDSKSGNGSVVTPGGFNIKYWLSSAADHRLEQFDIVKAMLDSPKFDEIRRGDVVNDKLPVRCPWEDEHTPGEGVDTGCYVATPGMSNQAMEFGCSHASCNGADRNDRAVLLCEMVVQGVIDEDRFYDPDYYVDGIAPPRSGSAASEGQVSEADEAKVRELVEQVKSAFASSGKTDWKMVKEVIKAVVKLDDAVTKLEAYDELSDAMCGTAKAEDRFLTKWNSILNEVQNKHMQENTAKKVIRVETIGVGPDGKLKLPKDSFYAIKNGQIYRGDDWLCQEIEHRSYGIDPRDGSATHTIAFKAYGHDGVKKDREFRYRRADLPKGDSVVAALGDAGFLYDLENTKGLRAFLNNIDVKPDTQIVDSSGWLDGASGRVFILPDGSHIGKAARKLQLATTTALTPFRSEGGSLAGWIEAVKPVFDDNAVGMEHWALCIMAGCAGTLLGYLKPRGLQAFALIGPSTIGKSEGGRLMASVQGPVGPEGLFFTCDMTPGAISAVFVQRSGLSPVLDEAHKANKPAVLIPIAWSDDGSGRGRLQRKDDDYVLGEIDTFVGMVCVTSEISIRALLERAGVPVPNGQDARLFEIQCDGVTRHDDPAFIKRMVAGAAKNHGWPLRAFVEALMKETPDKVQKDLEAAHDALTRPGMSSLERRSLEPLATIYLAGKIMQEIGIIPENFDVKRVVDWAIDNRVGGEKLSDEATRSGDALRTAYGQLMHDRIPLYDPRKIEDDYKSSEDKKIIGNLVAAAEDMAGEITVDGDLPMPLGNLPPVGYRFTDRNKEEIVIFYAKGFDKLIDGGNVETFLKSLYAAGYLVELKDGDRTRMKHKKMPNGLAIPNIRIRQAFFMGEGEA